MNIEQLAENAQQAEQFLKLMANKNRLMILCSLLQGEQSVGELNQNVPLAQSALSQHLASLRKAQLVANRRDPRSSDRNRGAPTGRYDSAYKNCK